MTPFRFNSTTLSLSLSLALALALGATPVFAADPVPSTSPTKISGLERVVQQLVKPPGVPAHSQSPSIKPRIVEVKMVIE
ncbi:hypothetical protein [Rhodoferax sp. PAMC 29310]|uniref:hypothetical protein n=1 Tax=Rhodoferax sp. PAMC 29310 TaxID=2822760 RepID=UPI00351CD27C